MNTKTLAVFNQRLAGYLMLNGFVLAGMRKDKNGSERNIFFFKDSETIRKEMTGFKNTKYF